MVEASQPKAEDAISSAYFIKGEVDLTRFFDTSALLNGAHETLIDPNPFLISLTSLRELENIKNSGNKDQQVKFKARQVLLYLYTNPSVYAVVDHTGTEEALISAGFPLTNDNRIMMEASNYEVANSSKLLFYTSDLSCHFLALNQFRLASKLYLPHVSTSHYEGYLRVPITDDELANFYTELPEEESPKAKNQYLLLTNEYLILENMCGSVVDMYRWNGKEHKPLDYQTIKTPYMGTIMPANLEQKLAFDLMQNRDIKIKILTGKFGTGKDYIMLAHALDLIKQEKMRKMVWIRNGVKVKNAADIGLLPGPADDKMMPYAMPIADHVGGKENLLRLIEEERIELENLGALRGRSWNNTIIYCSEAENLTKEHVQLLIGRVGEGSELWMNGDYRQVDGKVFETNNGLMTAIDRLKGRELFGYVKLQKTERSITAALADCLD